MNEISQFIDHTLLKPDALLGDFTQAVRDCNQYGFKSLCVNSGLVPLVSHLLFNNPNNKVALCSTIGFPLGNSSVDSKLLEINQGIKYGVTEFDVVPFIGAVKSGDWNHYEKEITQLREATKGFILKVILEVGLLTDSEVEMCCAVCKRLGVDFVKTSTGFGPKLEPEQTARYVKLMEDCVKDSETEVKASGWIRTLKDVRMMLSAGATRIGCSGSVKIMDEFNAR